jgi:hypothetical protein
MFSIRTAIKKKQSKEQRQQPQDTFRYYNIFHKGFPSGFSRVSFVLEFNIGIVLLKLFM